MNNSIEMNNFKLIRARSMSTVIKLLNNHYHWKGIQETLPVKKNNLWQAVKSLKKATIS